MKKALTYLLFIFPMWVTAQNTMYYMEHMPQILTFNPAMAPNVDLYFLLPGVSGLGIFNSGFNYNKLKEFSDNLNHSDYIPDNFVNSIGDYNKFHADGKSNIFGFGFHLKDNGYLSFQTSVFGNLDLKTESAIAYLLADLDNLSSEDFPIKVDGINLLAINYISWAASYSREINKQLRLGIRPSLNFNMFGVRTRNISYIITEDQINDEYEHELVGTVILGLPTEINPEATDGDELFQDRDLLPTGWIDDFKLADFFRNATLSLDIGGTYILYDWTFSASLLNIGASRWRVDGYRLTGKDDIIKIEDNKKIKIGIPPKIYLAAKRQFSAKWNYGLVFYNAFINNYQSTSATISLNGDIDGMISTSVSYTAGYKFNNIGLGMRLRFLPGTDLYFVTDNIIQVFSPKIAYRLTAAFGINVSVGIKDKIKEANTSAFEESVKL